MRHDDVYEQFVEQLFVNKSSGIDGLLHAAAGAAGEAGEVLDEVKKSWVYGKPLDRDKIIDELGDQLFYVQAACIVLGIQVDEVVGRNKLKLRQRYPQGYTDAAAIARVDKK